MCTQFTKNCILADRLDRVAGFSSTWGICEYNNNCYYPISKNSADPKAISENPLFVKAGFIGDGRNYGDYYKISPISPCIDAGISIPDNGSKDFWGKPLYNGLPDIGAMEFEK